MPAANVLLTVSLVASILGTAACERRAAPDQVEAQAPPPADGLPSFQAKASSYSVDPDYSSVRFSLRHLLGTVQGGFSSFSGKFTFDEKNPERSSGEFTVMAESVSTHIKERDEHLRSEEFFDTQKHPTLTFASKAARATNAKTFELEGNLTIRGVAKPCVLKVEYLGGMKNRFGKEKLSFHATTTLRRSDFGMVWNKKLDSGGLVLGDDVLVTLDIEAVGGDLEGNPLVDAWNKRKQEKLAFTDGGATLPRP